MQFKVIFKNLVAWVNERTGADKVWEAIFARRIPEARGWKSWLYTFGSALLFIFIIQVITGALLGMSYVPSPDHAYDSVRFISEEVFMGRFIRGLHHWGATAMVIFVFLHMIRIYFMGSYKYPREATWLAGVLILLTVMGFSFTGYLLPWDQKAYWATAVGVNIGAQAPILGPYIAQVLRGGEDMGAATLTRFYALHVLVLPTLAVLLVLVHLFLVVWHGISEPPAREKENKTKVDER